MSRYTILVILNLPIIIAGTLSAIVAYKLKGLSARKFWFQISLWTLILVSLVLTEPIYEFLFSNNLTQTEPLSLFDVIQITAIIFILYMLSRYRARLYTLERKLQDLHQELSILLSTRKGDK